MTHHSSLLYVMRIHSLPIAPALRYTPLISTGMNRRSEASSCLRASRTVRAAVVCLALSLCPSPSRSDDQKSEIPSDSTPTKTDTIDWQKERQFRSFQQPQQHALPKVSNTSWPSQPIDYFILAKLEAAKLAPSDPAPPRAL